MNVKPCVLLWMLLLSHTIIVSAQDEKLKIIRQHYTDVNEKIAKSKLPNEEGWGNYYSNEVIVNSHNGSWRALGNYLNKITFWYTDQPSMQENFNKSELSVLVKIEITSTAAATKTNEEFLYDDDKLVFYYIVTNPGSDMSQEYRYYFSDEKLFRYQENKEVIKNPEETSIVQVLKRSKQLQTLFLQTFN